VARTAPALVLSLLVLTTLVPASAVAGAGADTNAVGSIDLVDAPRADAVATSGPTISIDTTLSLTPDRPGSIGVVQTFVLPSEVSALRVSLDSGVTVTESSGFTQESDGTWAWDGQTSNPTLRYRKQANQTTQASGPLSASGSFLFADPGPWALVRTPNIGLQWRYRGSQSVQVSRATTVDGEGAVGGTTAFLGAHELYTQQANGQTFRLVVPNAADMESTPQRVLRGLANASRDMQVGDRDAEVFAVAAPTTGDRWAVQGLQVGSHDFWVRDSQSVESIGNAWLHEYVHTRQSFETAASAQWFTEASATWYAALLSLDEGATFTDIQQFLSRGESSPQADSVLSEPGSWQSNANYWKGALVLGELDRRIRLESNQRASLQAIFRSLNGRTDPVQNADIVAGVGSVATSSTKGAADRYTTTSAAPETWTSSAQREAFGSQPAQMQVTLDTGSDVRYSGPFRTGTADPPVTLAAGEQLSFRVTVRNVGDATGEYELLLRVADEPVANRTGTLAPGDTATAELTHRFDDSGTYTVSIGGERVRVEVREPATLTVTELQVDRSSVTVGETVTTTATVENAGAVPGNRTVAYTRDGETVARRTVRLGPGESATVSEKLTLQEAGEVRLGAGERAVTVEVREQGGVSQSDVPIPGFGVPAALAGIAALVLLTRGLRQG